MDLAIQACIKGDTHEGSEKTTQKMFIQKNTLHMPFPAMISLLVRCYTVPRVTPHVSTYVVIIFVCSFK